MGYAYAFLYPEGANALFENLQAAIAPRVADLSALSMIQVIFLNNLVASFIVMSTGVGFAIFTVSGIVLNGLVVGVVAYVVKSKSVLLLFSLLPHGVIELPIFLTSAAIGLRLGHEVINKIRRREEASITRQFKEGLKIYILWIVPLLLLAAIIEATISLRLAQLLK